MKTIRLLESVSGLDYNYRYGQIVLVEDTRADQLIAKSIAELYTGDGEYLEYVATFTKNGTSNPVMTVLNSEAPNFLSGIVATHGGATGLIAFTKANAFTEGKVICIVNNIYSASGSPPKIDANFEESDVSTLYVQSKDGDNVSTNNVDLAQIIIRVYA